jgi:peptidoglycan/LPS O-acetylase OafA/YrhL
VTHFGPGFLRLVLAALVLVQHFSSFDYGGWAVFVFFVLSGYWVSRMYMGKYRQGRAPWRSFVLNRYIRLLPVYLACLVLASAAYSYAQILPDFARNPAWWLRALPIVGSLAQPMLIAPFWSLDIEFQFYLIAPLIVVLMHRLLNRRAVIATAVFALAAVGFCFIGWTELTSPKPKLILYFLGFFLGGIAIHRLGYVATRRAALASLGALVVGAAVLTAYPGTRGIFISLIDAKLMALNPGISAIGTFVALPLISRIVARKSSPLDLHFGNFSYALYAFHIIPATIYYTWYGHLHSSMRRGPLAVALTAAIIGSLVVYLCIDRPFENLRRRLSERAR